MSSPGKETREFYRQQGDTESNEGLQGRWMHREIYALQCDLHFAENKAKIDIQRTARLRLYDWLANPKIVGDIDYDDMWEWMKTEIKVNG